MVRAAGRGDQLNGDRFSTSNARICFVDDVEERVFLLPKAKPHVASSTVFVAVVPHQKMFALARSGLWYVLRRQVLLRTEEVRPINAVTGRGSLPCMG
jgi:hypothetical protein